MQRFAILFGAALIGFAAVPTVSQAQVIVQFGRPYAPPPVILTQPSYYVAPSYYAAPSIPTYSSNYSATYSYYPPGTTVYSAPPPVVTYSAPPYVTYSAPAPVLVQRPGVVETRTFYGYGIFRPRGYYTQTRILP
ncbi:MAG: hypothetical protein HYX68_08145 [Planctomycetes bacterium]|jgi:hypothetical protein|nr:hypothetical protein [Planctomycetota bacterium]